MKKLILILAALLLSGAAAAVELNPSSDRYAVAAEEQVCLVNAVFDARVAQPMLSDDEAYQSATGQCVRYGFGNLRYAVYVKKTIDGTQIEPDSTEGQRWLNSAKRMSKTWLQLAMPKCGRLQSAQACLVELKLQ